VLNLEYPVIATFSKIPFNQKLGLFIAAHAEKTEKLGVHLRVHNSNSDTIFFQMDTTLLSDNNMFRAVLKPPSLKLEEGNYTLDLNLKSDNDSLRLQAPLEVRWLDKPRSLRTLEYALKPLEIILDKEEYDQINSGGKQEKAEKFLDFWKTKDPTPGTAYNELLFEFYSRVDSVDREFGGKNRTYGWRTDPGKIILLYGQPDFIEDQSLNPVRPFLSWRYDLPDTTLTFIFEAIDGRKRYRLIGQEENSN
jgi:GWxTD domain-containing protein